MYADGGSLYLRVAEGGSKQFIFRYIVAGKPHDMGIGPAHTFSLAEARERAREARKLLADGMDPLAAKREARGSLRAAAAQAKTFRQCAEGYIKDNESEWSCAKHRLEWERSLAKYAFPILGSLPVASIDTPLVLQVIKPLWQRVPETASRVRGRIENVLGWATVHHYRTGDNPARWSGLLEHALPAVVKGEHHKALPYVEMPAFMARVRDQGSVTAKCIEFIALTAARLAEAQAATWDEIDFEARTWTIPGSRMKAGAEHRVPLSPAALTVLAGMREIKQSNYVFPGIKPGQPIGDNMPLKLLGRMGVATTIHGLRSTFRDWAAETTNYPNHVVEQALAHAIPNAVEAAYRRGDLFEKRRRLMDAWADYCAKPATTGKVVPIRA
jgi:integrase